MKYNLLGAVSTIAIGVAFGLATPGAAIAGLVCTGPGTTGVGAGTCTETVNGANQLTGTSQDLIFNQWSAATLPGLVQNLQSVSYTASGTLNVNATITQNNGSTVNGSFVLIGERFNFNNTGAPTAFLVPALAIPPASTTKPVSVPSGVPTPFHYSSAMTPGSQTLTGGSLAGFSGNGTFDALVGTSGSSGFVLTNNNFTAPSTGNYTPTMVLTYNFTTKSTTPPVPEPASMALLGVGLAGLGALRRRRKA